MDGGHLLISHMVKLYKFEILNLKLNHMVKFPCGIIIE
jgi:hypothetical protein